MNYEVELKVAQSYKIFVEDILTHKIINWELSKIDKSDMTKTTTFNFQFKNINNLKYYKEALKHKITPLELQEKSNAKKQKNKFFLPSDKLARLKKRQNEMHKVWKLGNYIIVKCGSELQFCKIQNGKVEDKNPQEFEFNLGSNVWL